MGEISNNKSKPKKQCKKLEVPDRKNACFLLQRNKKIYDPLHFGQLNIGLHKADRTPKLVQYKTEA
jgi:hypothetical protein